MITVLLVSELWLEYLLGGILGVSIGFIGGFAGIGGGPFIVAGLNLVVGYSQHVAQGTTVAVMLGPMSLPGVIVMKDRVKILKWYILIGVMTYAFFSYVGAIVAYLFNNLAMQQLFGTFIFLLGARNISRAITAVAWAPPVDEDGDDDKASDEDVAAGDADAVEMGALPSTKYEKAAADDDYSRTSGDALSTGKNHSDKGDSDETEDAQGIKKSSSELSVEVINKGEDLRQPMNPDGLTYSKEGGWKFSYVTAALMGSLVGTVGGLFGIGAGVLMVPLMTTVWHVHKDDARAISLGILCPPVSLGAVIEYQRRGDIVWGMVVLQFVAYMSTNYWGAKLGKKVRPIMFGHALGSLLAALGILTFTLAALDCDGMCF